MTAVGARVCVIGAGPSGIAAAKNLRDAGLSVVVYDRGREVGGNWVFDDSAKHSSVFETTHIISSKRFSQYADYPMPDHYPDYPSHKLLAEYFQGYARRFELYPHIQFETSVLRCEKTPGERWAVTTTRGEQTETTLFDALVVANGHHSVPRYPQYPGTYSGELSHSHDYKRAEPFRGKRVLVIGGGNSACDVAVETARVAASTDLSWRRGYWIVPKFLFGQPVDYIHHVIDKRLGFLPTSTRLRALEKVLRLLNGRNADYGLPEPDHHLGETHPTLNSELLYFIRHGEIRARPDIARYDGKTVHFTDGQAAEYDAIVACTGYVIAHSFFHPAFIDFRAGPVPLYLKMLHADHPTLFFVGLFQPLGCIWPGAELQAKLAARMLTGQWSPPQDLRGAIARELHPPDVAQLDAPRHTITVEANAFHRRLHRELASASRS